MRKLFISILVLLQTVSWLSAREVTGYVTCGKERLSDVIVTDGKNFTLTNKKGKFKFEIANNADFVYVITPQGYSGNYAESTPVFYQAAGDNKTFVFDLVKTSVSDDYTLIAIADPQTQTEKHFKAFCGKPLDDLKATVSSCDKSAPVVGIILGDICWDMPSLIPDYNEVLSSVGIPFYPVIGNHDHDKDAKGDHNTSGAYREGFGPENYAFAIGKDYVIAVDNVIYDTNKKYVEGYSDDVLDFVKGLLPYIPQDAHIYLAQHCPMKRWFKENTLTKNGDKMLEILAGRKVTVLSGHTHINNNMKISEDVYELNIASICGSWWVAYHCNDGTPSGYKVINKKEGELSWYYKSLDHGVDYQAEYYLPGKSRLHPNAVVANVWDFDEEWTIEWYEDGRMMGPMKQVLDYSPVYEVEINTRYKGRTIPGYKLPRPNTHYFIAVPSQYAKNVEIVISDRFGHEWKKTVSLRDYVDVQAHRGGAGLMPENTLESMKNAIDLGVNTLELDLQISADGQVVVSHDAYFHSRYATRPDGSTVKADDPKEYLYKMPYSEIRKYDTGKRKSTVWPDKACIPAYKPLADELIDFVENYVAEKGLTPVRYNIEIKCKEGKTEGENWPEYHEFVDRCVEFLLSKNLGDRLVVQCFDVRALNYMHEKYPQLYLSYLVGEKDKDFDEYMAKLDFTPVWLSPHYSNTDAELCRKAWERGMKIVPWTADSPEDIQRLVDLKVDAIISNYPDRVLKITRGY